ncbi:hypothetical protein HNY73_000214 [Argiope bruennichi]|uniref:FAD dependent oxidoreductase domain-containing protein n=1 Tax=Argiope bruennichi TaxID=94029 RepID=A0A8T0FXF6_ARGBR|nr:hypothetical protein HNY73_000214 [Argiope bruennichi]
MQLETFDLCIIGAGMYGSAAARHASSNSGVKVCLIGPGEPREDEIETREILSSHYDEGRIVHIAYASPVMQVLVRHTIKRFREIEKLSGINFFSPVGTIITAERGTSYFYTLLQGFEMHDVNYIDLSKEDIMKQRFPYLKLDDCDHPLFDDDSAGFIKARGMVEAQKKIAHLQGCHIVDDVVEEVKDFKDGAHQIITKEGHVLRAKKVLFCTGAFTAFKKFDPLKKKLKIQVNRETAAMLRIPEEEKDRLSSMPTMMMYRDNLALMPAVAKGAYILPPIKYPDGHWYLKLVTWAFREIQKVNTLEEIKEWYKSDGDQEVIDKYSRFLISIIPGLKVEEVKGKTCITCDSPSGLPYIDRISLTVTVAVVGNGKGATICDEVGRIAADLSLTGKWKSELPQK